MITSTLDSINRPTMFVQLITIAFLAAVSAEPINQQLRIVGGKDTVIESYPYQASLQYNGKHICGASIISKNYLVTAAHCIKDPTSSLIVRVGSSYHSHGGKVHQVISAISHENYTRVYFGDIRKQHHDVAILKVEPTIEFSDKVQPIGLNDKLQESDRPLSGLATVTGWGLGRITGSITAQLKSYIDRMTSALMCNDRYQKYGGIFEGQICTYTYEKGPCDGDFGGPLAINGQLAGIVSWSGGCASNQWPVLYTEVAYYRQWIEQHAELA